MRNDVNEHVDGGIIKDFAIEIENQRIRYIKIFAKNIGQCPDWLKDAGNPAWIFVDEVWWK